MQTLPKSSVLLRCDISSQCEFIQCISDTRSAEVRESFLAIRFGLELGIVYVSREILTESGDLATLSLPAQDSSKGYSWTLHHGSTYIVYGRQNRPRESFKIHDLIEDLDHGHDLPSAKDKIPRSNVLPGTGAKLSEGFSCPAPGTPVVSRSKIEAYPGWPGFSRDPHLLSAFDAAMSISAGNELGKLCLAKFSIQRVKELRQQYNGNQIFELLPLTGLDITRRNGFRAGMNRRNDCYLWTRLITTKAGHGRRKLYAISHMSCVGALKCVNLSCSYRATTGECNVSDWPTGIHREHKYTVGDFVPAEGHRCSHCGFTAMCYDACDAKIYFVLPSKRETRSSIVEEVSHMSRCAIHVGNHSHPPRSSAPRHLVDLVEGTVKEEFHRNPKSPPSVVRKQAIASVLEKLASGSLSPAMTDEQKFELFRGISSVAHPDKVLNMIKSIRRAATSTGELSAIAEMQKNTIYRTVQRSLFPGQADIDSMCHILEFPTKPERERTCLFHFEQSLQMHTKQGIIPENRDEHIALWRRM
ncbi:hypothetical protein R1sor_006647 [Riccia sorocarpa]|uniref:Uncharacterized protein n=1 Tax=Riccia sorocarpa TaxID=122646 RepID=A0ABD3HSA4_9MARC